MSKDKKAILWARRNLLKTMAIAMAIVVAFSAGYLAREAVLTQTPSTITISPQNFIEGVSYTIFIDDDGLIKAKNGKTSVIDFQGTDPSTVIQLAVNALTNGGIIFIKRGVYNISKTINISSPVIIEGEGPDWFGTHGTYLKGSNI